MNELVVYAKFIIFMGINKKFERRVSFSILFFIELVNVPCGS